MHPIAARRPGARRRQPARIPVSQFAFALLLATASSSAWAATLSTRHLEVMGQSREYVLVRPERPTAGRMPLVVLLHGHFGSAANALGSGRRPSPLSAWRDIADRESVLVAALQGQHGRDGHSGWNDCRADARNTPQSDDVAFAGAVAAELARTQHADLQRLYVMGMSNGAMMAFRLAQEMQPPPVAIAAVSGSMARNSACTGAPPVVSVLMISGRDDPLVPYAGGAVGRDGSRSGTVTGAEATRRYWLQADDLTGAAASADSLPHLDADDPTRATRLSAGSDRGPQVELVTITGGGHVEPSLRFHYGALYHRLVGAQNRDFESAEMAWSFFSSKRRLPAATPGTSPPTARKQ